MRADAPEWEPGRRDTLETLLSDFVPPFPRRGGGMSALWRAKRQAVRQGFGTMPVATHGKSGSRASHSLSMSLEPAAGDLYNSRIEISPGGRPPEPIVKE